MIAGKMAPGLRRSFAFEEMELVSDRLIQEVRTEAAKKIDRELELDIMGCDIDARMAGSEVHEIRLVTGTQDSSR